MVSPLFASRMVECVTDPTPTVRQAACFGIGMMGLHGGAAFLPYQREALPLLQRVLNDPGAREIENRDATENALSAYVKLSLYGSRTLVSDCHSNPAMSIPRAVSIPAIAGWLPLTADNDEAIYVYQYLCQLLERYYHSSTLCLVRPHILLLPRIVSLSFCLPY